MSKPIAFDMLLTVRLLQMGGPLSAIPPKPPRSAPAMPHARFSFFAVPILAIALAVSSLPAAAQLNDDDILGARSEGMANAFRALAFDNSAIDLNPAGMAQFPRVSLDIGYRLDVDTDASRFQVSLIDALSSRVAGGMAYSFETADTPDSGTKAKGQKVLTGFAFPLAKDKLFFGFNTRFVRLDYPDNSQIKDLRAFTADVGVLIRPFKFIAIGGAVNNLVDADRPELPLNAGAGIAALVPRGGGTPLAMVGADITADFASGPNTLVGWATGAQVAVTQQIWLRTGYALDGQSQKRHVAAGISYAGEQWGVDYAVQVPTKGGAMRHIVDINLFVF